MGNQNMIKIDTPDFNNEITDIYQSRTEMHQSKNESDVTIIVIAYNRIDVTRLCIESILKNTKGINYKLALVYNDNPGNEEILDYFKAVGHENKVVMHITRNIGAAFAYQQIMKYVEGKYIVHLPNDIIVTPNWLDNLIKCAESDVKIGMVNPVSSNVSNLQQVDLDFKNYEDMQIKAGKFNISDSKKWSERLRLITLATLFKRECLSIVGDIFDTGFAHNFGDDDITFRIRRAGYKTILAEDTWVHHDHLRNNMTYEEVEKFNDNLRIGRNAFKEKYFGIDAWDDVNNYIPEILPHIRNINNENVSILGVDVRCGTPILEIKNKLRKMGVDDVECCASTSEGKYFIDLQTVCDADNVLACCPGDVSNNFSKEVFDYIIIGENINEYPEPFVIIKNVYSLLKKGGSMFVYLKNTYDIHVFLNIIGYRRVRPEKYTYNITIESFIEKLNLMNITSQFIGSIPYNNLPNDYIKEMNLRLELFAKEEFNETVARLTADRFVLIGMIVKNEEKVLERCLKSLQPLMKAVPSELIIADTGSTDSTVEIAKKYTDNVFYFEWINDFAAARNSTLKKSKGKWYFFLDADEYLDEDISEIINFFSIPDLYLKYKTLEIIIRNYTDVSKTNYRDACLARFQRINDPENPVEFIGKIHESIWIRQPLGYFSTILHHTGYCYYSNQQNMDKKNRNMQLMREEYKNNPNDLRLLCHMIDGASLDNNEKEKYISEALAIAKAERRHLYSNVVYMQAIQNLQNSKPEYCLKLCREYYDTLEGVENCVATVAVAMTEANILSALARYKESYNAFCHYFNLYEKYKKDELILTDASAHPIDGLTESEYIRYNCMAALDLKRCKEYEDAFKLLDKFNITDLDGEDFRNVLGSVREICQDMKKYDMLAYYYEKIMKCKDENKRSLALYMMESTYYSIIGKDKRMDFAKDIVESNAKGRYCDLMKLVISQNEEDFTKNLFGFINSTENWKDGYTEAIYLAVKHKLDISDSVDRMNAVDFRTKLELIANNHDDFAGYVLEYGIPESYTASIKKFLWIVSVYEKASYRSFILDDNQKYELYMRFTNLLGEYVSNIYNPELLKDESDVEVLPPLHRFGYYMFKANNALAAGERVEYIREMKKALVNCESMKEIVEFLLGQFKKLMGM